MNHQCHYFATLDQAVSVQISIFGKSSISMKLATDMKQIGKHQHQHQPMRIVMRSIRIDENQTVFHLLMTINDFCEMIQ